MYIFLGMVNLFILFIGVDLFFSDYILSKMFGVFFIGIVVLLLIMFPIIWLLALKQKYIKLSQKMEGGHWYVEMWVDNNIMLKNIGGMNEVCLIPFSDIKEWGEETNEYYLVFRNQTFRFPKNSFIEGDWSDMLEKIAL